MRSQLCLRGRGHGRAHTRPTHVGSPLGALQCHAAPALPDTDPGSEYNELSIRGAQIQSCAGGHIDQYPGGVDLPDKQQFRRIKYRLPFTRYRYRASCTRLSSFPVQFIYHPPVIQGTQGGCLFPETSPQSSCSTVPVLRL